MRFAALLAFASLLVSPIPAWADGYATTKGRSTDGWNLVFGSPDAIEMWRDGDTIHAQSIEDEPCEFRDDLAAIPRPHEDATGALVCAASGRSPLAGAVYEIRPIRNSVCERGDPADRLTCVSGCGPGTRAPRVLLRGYWEC